MEQQEKLLHTVIDALQHYEKYTNEHCNKATCTFAVWILARQQFLPCLVAKWTSQLEVRLGKVAQLQGLSPSLAAEIASAVQHLMEQAPQAMLKRDLLSKWLPLLEAWFTSSVLKLHERACGVVTTFVGQMDHSHNRMKQLGGGRVQSKERNVREQIREQII